MRALCQRVKSASVTIDNKVKGKIKEGYLVLFGVQNGDSDKEAEFLAKKTAELRVFSDEKGLMNKSILDVGGEILAVSQFTLYADCKNGRRPSFINAMRPPESKTLYENYVKYLRDFGIHVETGEFGADMLVELQNDGPVTIMLDTDEIMKGK